MANEAMHARIVSHGRKLQLRAGTDGKGEVVAQIDHGSPGDGGHDQRRAGAADELFAAARRHGYIIVGDDLHDYPELDQDSCPTGRRLKDVT